MASTIPKLGSKVNSIYKERNKATTHGLTILFDKHSNFYCKIRWLILLNSKF